MCIINTIHAVTEWTRAHVLLVYVGKMIEVWFQFLYKLMFTSHSWICLMYILLFTYLRCCQVNCQCLFKLSSTGYDFILRILQYSFINGIFHWTIDFIWVLLLLLSNKKKKIFFNHYINCTSMRQSIAFYVHYTLHLFLNCIYRLYYADFAFNCHNSFLFHHIFLCISNVFNVFY